MLLAQVALLWARGSFRGEFGEYPDEPSHFVTGLMVRDYVLSGAFRPGPSVLAYRLLTRQGQARSRHRIDLPRRPGRDIEN